jgi:hypothetical protein
VITRVYAVTCDSAKDQTNVNGEDNLLVPFADMANHETPPNTHWGFSNDDKQFVVSSSGEILANSPIYETYGFKSNYRYFVNYGFTVSNNKHELVGMRFNRQHDTMFTNYVNKLHEFSQSNESIMDVFNKVFDIVQVPLQTLIYTDSVFEVGYIYDSAVKSMLKYLRGSDTPNAKVVEIGVHNRIIEKARYILEKMVDVETSEFVEVSQFNIHNIKTIKNGERYLLAFWIDMSNQCINIINNQTQIAVRKFNKKMKKYHNIATFTPYMAELLKLM